MSKNWLINRRTLLKASGVSMALPFLDVMGLEKAQNKAPKRFVSMYFPNGVYPTAWEASGSGKGYELKQVLEPFNAIKDKVTTIKNLDHGGGHIFNTSGFLSGVVPEKGTNASKVLSKAVSIDQIIAKRNAQQTYLPSLNLGVHPPVQGKFGGVPRSHGNSISWTHSGNKIEPEIYPQAAFDSLFGHRNPEMRKMSSRRQRIIDSVWPQAKTMRKQVSKSDEHKLEQYFDSVRDIEAKLEKAMNPPAKTWTPLVNPKISRPASPEIPANHEEHVKLMMDIILLGLWTDTTRVSTLMLGVSISKFDYGFLPNAGEHHAMSHHRNDAKKIERYNNISKWFSQMALYLMQRMDAVDEGGRSLLDNSAILFGSGLKDGNTHDGEDIPVLVAGGAGGSIKSGRHIVCKEGTRYSNLLLTLLNKFDVNYKDLNETGSKLIKELA
ncbi:MAG: DUF1552 domain-containing protein [Lentisphaeraceae bacterium]|nr:DUF1552 domain-containing protein [Lentisphaeraceae bacterium]